MKLIKLSFVFAILFIVNVTSVAQDLDLPDGVTAELVQSEIQKRGLEEDEVREALLKNGYDLDNLGTIGPEEFPKIQSIIDGLSKGKEDVQVSDVDHIMEVVEEIVELPEIKTAVKEKVVDIAEDIKNKEIYGHRMFRNKEIKFYSNRDGIRAPDYYVLGAGDELAVSIFGNSYKEGSYTINGNGYIQILNNQKKVTLKGLTLGEARKKLKRLFAAFYKFQDDEFSLSLNYSRPVTISVYGEVMKPGAITLPAINNVFNVLAAVNGPNEIGSIRKIQIIRKNGQKLEVDLFDYIKNPSKNKSFFLSDNDIIIVPAVEILVEIEGAINRPMLYELKKGEGLKTLVSFAGGFTKQAYTKSLKVVRIKDNEKVFVDIDYSNNRHFSLQKGDVINIKEISTSLTNFVEINGEVVSEGQYQRTKGMKILDLVNKAGLKRETKTDLMYLRRVASDNSVSYIPIDLDEIISNTRSSANILLEDKDQLILWSKDLFLEKGSVIVSGAVRDSISIEVNGYEDLTVRDAILLAGGLSLDASDKAMIYREDPQHINKVQYINLSFKDGQKSEDFDIKLKSNDRLKLLSNSVFSEKTYISISGAVHSPGKYTYGEGMSLKQILILAEGTKISAAKNRIELSRTIFKDNKPTEIVIATLSIDHDFNVVGADAEFELKPYDKIFVREIADFEMQKTIQLNGEVRHPGAYTIVNDNETILDVLNRAGGITKEGFTQGASLFRVEDDLGFLIIRLDEVMKDKNNKFNFKVRGGDILEIPKMKDFVAIKGATKVKYTLDEKLIDEKDEIHVPYQKGKSLRYYIEEYAGGLDKKADKSKISVKYANGSIKSSKNYLLFRRYPKIQAGSVIIVGYKDKKVKKKEGQETKKVDWDKIVNNTVSQATTLLTLLIVSKSLSN